MKRRINILKIFVLVFALMIAATSCTQTKDPETSYNSTKSNRQIVEAIFYEIYLDDVDGVDFAMNEADKLPNKYLGKITSEEDAKEKAEIAWKKIGGNEYTNDEKPYEAKYYKKYDAWLINGTLNGFGTDSSGREYATPGGVDLIILKASNGEVLAVWGEA